MDVFIYILYNNSSITNDIARNLISISNRKREKEEKKKNKLKK